MELRSDGERTGSGEGGCDNTDTHTEPTAQLQSPSISTEHQRCPSPGSSGTGSVEIDEMLADIECLARSQNRLRILQRLSESPCSSAELRQELGIPRTTLRRNLIELEEKHWIRTSPTAECYRIAPPGQLFLEKFHELLEVTQVADRLGSFLDRFPAEIPAGVECLRACRITRPGTHDPHAPMNRLLTLIDDASILRGFVPIMCAMYARAFANRASDGTDFELITRPRAVEALRADHPSLLEPLANVDSGCLLVTEELPRYSMYLLNGIVVLAAYDGDGRIHSLLEATDAQTEIVDWAEQQYASYEQTAETYSRVE